jgi:hypothetical protein
MVTKFNYPTPGVTYRHYEGGLYEVLHLAEDRDHKSTVVVYKSVHFGTYYTKTLEKWLEKIEAESPHHPNTRYTPVYAPDNIQV